MRRCYPSYMTDTNIMLSEPEDGSIQESSYHLPQPLRGPFLDELTGCGVDLRSPGDDITSMDRDYKSVSTIVQIDKLKDHEEEQEPTQRNVLSPDQTTDDAAPLANPAPVRHDDTSVSIEDSLSIPVQPLAEGVAPPLSEGKKYHVFFSYEISDREWVEEVTKRLESPEMGFRCSMHERDFHGGKRIIENITEHIRHSEKTVLVLSPDFLQSHWCMFEIEMGMILSMEESQLLVVPVMVKRCCVPDSIKTLTYIDATPGNDWWQRFIGAIVCKDDLLSTFSGASILTIRPRHGNMDMLTKIYSNFKWPSGELIRAPYVPDVLLAPGVEVPPEQFDQAMDVIRSSSCICRHCYDNVPCCVCFLVVLLLTGLVIMPTIVILVAVSPLPAPPGFPVFILMTSLPSILFITAYFVQRQVRKSRLQKAVLKANEILLKYKVILGASVQVTGCTLFRTCIRFWFYDTAECKKVLASFLEERHGAKRVDSGVFQVSD
ncbi:uncharacterized protein [Haliotis asinina]|uniref:uncharacterized protein isoform X2 n=1 Tax=Haliotis asinina TaxID=109174 RepID=UPI00353217B9